jgi:magnesium-protoporphyrin O-methyltransferase
MACTNKCCCAFENAFDAEYAEGDLKDYLKDGPAQSTLALLRAVQSLTDVRGATVLDIGGGVGVIQWELLQAGAQSSFDVDGSPAYIAVARREAGRRGYGDRTGFLHGDFTQVADQVEAADIVTLDRVICCYPDMHALVGAAAQKTRRVLALVWPREAWWMHAGVAMFNLFERFNQYPFVQTLHAQRDVDAVAGAHGLDMKHAQNTGLWQVRVYARAYSKQTCFLAFVPRIFLPLKQPGFLS